MKKLWSSTHNLIADDSVTGGITRLTCSRHARVIVCETGVEEEM